MKFASALLALTMAAPAAAQGAAEWVAQAPLPALVIGHEHHARGSTIVERIPPGENVERWTRMVTNQRFAGFVANGGTLDSWLDSFNRGLGEGCPRASATAPVRFVLSGRPALDVHVTCPRNPATGLPEGFYLRAIAGRADLHIVQVAFRRVVTAEDARFASRHLATVLYCQRDIASPACLAAAASPEAR